MIELKSLCLRILCRMQATLHARKGGNKCYIMRATVKLRASHDAFESAGSHVTGVFLLVSTPNKNVEPHLVYLHTSKIDLCILRSDSIVEFSVQREYFICTLST